MHDDVNGVAIEEVTERTGWAVFTGCEGEVANFHAFFGDREDAERFIDGRRDPDRDGYLFDPDIAPAVIIDGKIVAANNFDFQKGAEAVIALAGLDDNDAARLRREAAPLFNSTPCDRDGCGDRKDRHREGTGPCGRDDCGCQAFVDAAPPEHVKHEPGGHEWPVTAETVRHLLARCGNLSANEARECARADAAERERNESNADRDRAIEERDEARNKHTQWIECFRDGQLDRNWDIYKDDRRLAHHWTLGRSVETHADVRAGIMKQRDEAERRLADEKAAHAQSRRQQEEDRARVQGAIKKIIADEEARVDELRRAIGVMVPTIIRCFIEMSTERPDKDSAAAVLVRVEQAMEATKPARDCSCIGSCRGPDGLRSDFRCVMGRGRGLIPIAPPDARPWDAAVGARRYLTDDRDHAERFELLILPATGTGNGDWYLAVVPEGHKTSKHTVRICTSGGAAATHPELVLAVANMYRALAGELAYEATSDWALIGRMPAQSALQHEALLRWRMAARAAGWTEERIRDASRLAAFDAEKWPGDNFPAMLRSLERMLAEVQREKQK